MYIYIHIYIYIYVYINTSTYIYIYIYIHIYPKTCCKLTDNSQKIKQHNTTENSSQLSSRPAAQEQRAWACSQSLGQGRFRVYDFRV